MKLTRASRNVNIYSNYTCLHFYLDVFIKNNGLVLKSVLVSIHKRYRLTIAMFIHSTHIAREYIVLVM